LEAHECRLGRSGLVERTRRVAGRSGLEANRLRSKKNSSGLSEDVLDDVLGKVVLLGDSGDRLARAPEGDDVLRPRKFSRSAES
jgi:hypothetical protein